MRLNVFTHDTEMKTYLVLLPMGYTENPIKTQSLMGAKPGMTHGIQMRDNGVFMGGY